jgi:hypothetical protein
VASREAEIDGAVRDARTIERRSINAGSYSVLFGMLFDNPGNLVIALVIYLLSLAVQLAPFLLKTYAGQTALGLGFGVDREIGRLEAETRLLRERHEKALILKASEMVMAAGVDAMQTEPVQTAMKEAAADHAIRMAPIYAAVRTAEEMTAAEAKLGIEAVKAPQLASLFYRIWTEAIRRIHPGAAGPWGAAER